MINQLKNLNIQKTILDNGLTVCSVQKDINTTQINIGIKTGSIYEDKCKNGFSHFCEHMLFKGTNTYTSKDLLKKILLLGENMSAYTNYSEVCLYGTFIHSDTEQALEIMSDMITNSSFDENEFNNEKQVILAEIVRDVDDSNECSHMNHLDFMYGANKHRYDILGGYKQIQKCNRNELFSFYKDNFVSNNSIVVIVSPYSHEEIVEFANKYFGKWGNVSKLQKYLIPTPKNNKNFKKFKIDCEQSMITTSFDYSDFDKNEKFALEFANILLGGGYNSSLFKILREKYGLCYEVGSYIGSPFCNKNLYIYTSVEHDKVAKTIQAIDEAILDMQNIENFDDIKQIYKRKVILDICKSLESTEYLNQLILEEFTRLESVDLLLEYIEFIGNLDYEFYLKTIKKLFNRKIITVSE